METSHELSIARSQEQMSAQSTPLSSRPNWVGIDVSNAKLAAYEIESAQAQRFTNDSKGIEQLHPWSVSRRAG